MHAYSRFTVHLTATESDIQNIHAAIAKKLEWDEDVDFEEDITSDPDAELQTQHFDIEDDYNCAYLEDVEELAAAMALKAPSATFQLDGVIDTSESAGEYMDFLIVYQDGKLTSRSSCWYLQDSHDYFMDCYPDYETFSEEFWDNDNDQPKYTEEEYDEACNWDWVFFLNSGHGDMVSNVPLEEPEELDLSEYEDEDFDEED